MNNNVIEFFPVVKPKIDLYSPEVKELIDKIMELTQCNNLIVLQADNPLKVLRIGVGDINLADTLTMLCYGIFTVINQRMENEDDHI